MSPTALRNLVLCLLWLALPLATPAQQTDTYQVIHSYPHDAQAFTQGLVYLVDSHHGKVLVFGDATHVLR